MGHLLSHDGILKSQWLASLHRTSSNVTRCPCKDAAWHMDMGSRTAAQAVQFTGLQRLTAVNASARIVLHRAQAAQ